MKKILCAILAGLCIVSASALTAFADDQEFTTYTEAPDTPGEELLFATGDMDDLTGYNAKGGIGVDLHNLASGGVAYCLKNDTSTWYDFEVSEKTDVTFYIGYIARTGTNRGIDYSVDDPNGEHRVFIDLAESADEQWVSGTFTVDAGKHTFYLYAPMGMDDSTLKSCDVYSIELYGSPASDTATTEAAADTAAVEVPDMEAPVLDYPSMDVIANSGAGYDELEAAAAAIGKTAITDVTFVTGSNGNSNEGPENLWDNDVTTKFCTGEFPTQSLAMYSTPITVDGIIMATANDNSSYNNRSPFEWAIYVSADGENWTAIAYGDDTFFEEVDYTYYSAAVATPISGVKYAYFQSEGALSGCFQVSELILTGTASEEAAPAAEETEAAVEETEAPAETEAAEVVEETVETKAEETTAAPQTFDAGIIAAAAAVVSAAGYAISKKRR
jgi:hypothetical protein